MAMGQKGTRLDLPGFTLPLDHTPGEKYQRVLFPNALDSNDIEGGWAGRVYVHREILMMQVINIITDKPEWERKVFDDEIVPKWRDEIAASGKDITPKMMDWIIAELRWKADRYRETDHVVAFETGVVKSDSTISMELKESLRKAVRSLEDVPEEEKDYHPGSDKKVVDLVHPSLFPVIYGRSRILPDRLIGVDNCLDTVGQGQQLAVPPKIEASREIFLGPRGHRISDPFSRKFQWMPCDIEFTGDQGCRIVSYINNLHPERNRDLYGVIEKILAKVIPLWDATLTDMMNFKCRIPYTGVEFLENPNPEPEEPEEPEDGNMDEMEEYYERLHDWEAATPIKLPEPGVFEPRCPDPTDGIDLRKQFAEHGLQVIVKLANIELTPEKPDYAGGSWHVEGQSNEHICASALYYYDCENITQNHLSFRQRANEEDIQDINYPQSQHRFLSAVFGFPPDTYSDDIDANVTQTLGSVSTREGRLLTFPNILQHCVSPFSLADKSKPGHRKILAFFLVDPHMRIISSANIPPQNQEWWSKRDKVMDEVLGNRLPVELQTMVNDNIAHGPITMDEAKQYRLELMEERSVVTGQQNKHFESGGFNLCEH